MYKYASDIQMSLGIFIEHALSQHNYRLQRLETYQSCLFY